MATQSELTSIGNNNEGSSGVLNHGEQNVSELAAKAIEKRADERMLKVNMTTDLQLAKDDALDFSKIVEPKWKTIAALQINDNLRELPDYRNAFEKTSPDALKEIQVAVALHQYKQAPTVADDEVKALVRNAVDSKALEEVVKRRNSEFDQARKELGINSIEAVLEAEKAPQKVEPSKSVQESNDAANEIDSDEIFNASKIASKVKTVIPQEIERKFVRVGDRYYYTANTEVVAFEDKGNVLKTKSDSENMASNLVEIALARGWDEIKVSGSETFKREAWLAAATRGMHVKGYTPTDVDLAYLAKRIPENKVEKVLDKDFRGREKVVEAVEDKKQANIHLAKVFQQEQPLDVAKKHPELAGAVALSTVAIEEHTNQLNQHEKAIVVDQVKKNVAKSIENGNLPDLKLAEKITRTIRQESKIENEKDLSL